jgi:outer membrane protein assembly complex protein YaeT
MQKSSMTKRGGAAGGGARVLIHAAALVLVILLFVAHGFSQTKYDDRPIGKVEVNFGENDNNAPLLEEFRLTARDEVGATYSAARIRDAINALYGTKRVETITVAANLDAAGNVDLVFNIKRKVQAQKVAIVVADAVGEKVTEQELLFKLNVLQPGTAITEQTLRNSADEILDYLRERGFYRSEVTYERRPLQNQNDVGVTFKVTPNEQAKVSNFTVNIEGYNKPLSPNFLKLQPGEEYSRDRLLGDMKKIRDLLKKDKFLAPQLDDPKVTYDSDTNTISIVLTGKVGPTVEVTVESPKKIRGSTQTSLLPVKRDGTLDFSAIVEGERRLENFYQEKGYFFADVKPVCSAAPPLLDTENVPITNETNLLCSSLSGENLTGSAVQLKYVVDAGRRFTLRKIQIQGTDKLTIEDIRTVLRSQEANLLGIIPVLGYGRGYTSAAILEEDTATIRSLMAELGYRDAVVNVNQGISPNGDDFIITFVVDEGLPTVISDVSISGNSAVKTDELLSQIPLIVGKNYSRARERNAVRKLREYYSNLGYYDARVTSKMVETSVTAERKNATIEFSVENEGKKVIINRILVNGNENTDTDAVLRALTLRSGELLRSADVYTSEQNLYQTDAFSRVEIKPQPAGDAADGSRKTDIIVTVEEQPPRLMTYGGGASTDFGLDGFFDIRHVNLFGNLWQGGARIRASQRQQLVQFDFINPRFIRDGNKRFAPLTVTAAYQRDTTITRFFRSAFDRGTFGIVQRLDEDGNPIDEFGNETGSPTLNRLSLSAETSRTISRRARSLFFLRYRFEDVRLFKIESLLIKELLRPDARVRISGFGATFVRDTRRNCSVKYSLLDLIAKGDQTEPCRYNAGDPTKGSFLTADYNVSFPAIGANIGFQKFQATYNYYYTFPGIRSTTLAARGIIGVGHVFSGGDRFNNAQFPSLNGLLPISERFYGGGSNTLRGFDLDEAGPRVVIVPQGTFVNSDGERIRLDPFTVPFGGNALAVVNLEARIPLSRAVRAVPFYDGGNVFRRAGDIFHTPEVDPNDVEGQNQRAVWSHTVGFGLRLKTPVGGEFGVDYGYLLNPPEFLIPQSAGGNAIYRLQRGHIHFRFSQAF